MEQGGETVLENLQILCNICNIGKSDLEPRT
ncbi:MAG TPA: HNH endonuclease [Terriglobia bacterium]|nr:HNH endonuclease [Terriglobia bacterium]